jgi:hypothetical protein
MAAGAAIGATSVKTRKRFIRLITPR